MRVASERDARVGDAHRSSSSMRPPARPASRAQRPVHAQVLGELALDGRASGAGRSSGPGRPSPPAIPAQGAQVAAAQAEHVAVRRSDEPRRCRGAVRQQAERGQRGQRLAAAALAGEAHHLAGVPTVRSTPSTRSCARPRRRSRRSRISSRGITAPWPGRRASGARIEGVAQRVAEEVERQHDGQDRQAREQRHPPVVEHARRRRRPWRPTPAPGAPHRGRGS